MMWLNWWICWDGQSITVYFAVWKYRDIIKNYKSANPGSIKVVYGPCEQESEEKNSKFWFLNMQNKTFPKKEIASEK